MTRMQVAAIGRVASIGLFLALGGCSVFRPQQPPAAPAAEAKPQLLPPLATHTFPFDPKATGVVGELQVTFARQEDTIPDIARRFNLGFDEVARANPGVDVWLPGEGTRILLPTQFVLPEAPHEGVVVNVAALRLFYFPKPAEGEQRVVMTFPIGIGKVGWATPVGTTKVVSKRKDPWWTPPASVRKEHAEEGDPLPARVPPGPDNPLGAYAMNLGWTSYLIHGTNKPAGVGLRASHGCIRMYPEDIATVFDRIPVGTKVTVVNQPLVYRWQGDSLYVQAYPTHEDVDSRGKSKAKGKQVEPADEDEVAPPQLTDAVTNKMFQKVKPHGGAIDLPLTEQVVREAKGVAVPVSRRGTTLESFLAAARLVENAVPAGATWDGQEAPADDDQPKPVADAGSRGGR
ncbi:MAG: L,D-transpeptidase family protein [Steroidobacteraceae bacterium]|nr:L,D-transpeptidase family protein [Steroidobacteraceae bacterium]